MCTEDDYYYHRCNLKDYFHLPHYTKQLYSNYEEANNILKTLDMLVIEKIEEGGPWDKDPPKPPRVILWDSVSNRDNYAHNRPENEAPKSALKPSETNCNDNHAANTTANNSGEAPNAKDNENQSSDDSSKDDEEKAPTKKPIEAIQKSTPAKKVNNNNKNKNEGTSDLNATIWNNRQRALDVINRLKKINLNHENINTEHFYITYKNNKPILVDTCIHNMKKSKIKFTPIPENGNIDEYLTHVNNILGREIDIIASRYVYTRNSILITHYDYHYNATKENMVSKDKRKDIRQVIKNILKLHDQESDQENSTESTDKEEKNKNCETSENNEKSNKSNKNEKTKEKCIPSIRKNTAATIDHETPIKHSLYRTFKDIANGSVVGGRRSEQ